MIAPLTPTGSCVPLHPVLDLEPFGHQDFRLGRRGVVNLICVDAGASACRSLGSASFGPSSVAPPSLSHLESARWRSFAASRGARFPLATRSPFPAGLKQEPGAPFRLIDPRLDEARRRDVAMLVTDVVGLPEASGEILVVFAKFGQHV